MEDINVFELKQKLDAGEEFLLLDVREPFEAEMYNIGAKLIPLGSLVDHLGELEEYKDKEIVVHCRSGARSGNAKQIMTMSGFTKVRNLLGGMLAWQEAFENPNK
ncbi:MAG: rhodanese-like domain-containing protein [Saprospiraceae bacterium]|nr:rhodanese-like domain-containing protein [Saprospiraceae bacterium]